MEWESRKLGRGRMGPGSLTWEAHPCQKQRTRQRQKQAGHSTNNKHAGQKTRQGVGHWTLGGMGGWERLGVLDVVNGGAATATIRSGSQG